MKLYRNIQYFHCIMLYYAALIYIYSVNYEIQIYIAVVNFLLFAAHLVVHHSCSDVIRPGKQVPGDNYLLIGLKSTNAW